MVYSINPKYIRIILLSFTLLLLAACRPAALTPTSPPAEETQPEVKPSPTATLAPSKTPEPPTPTPVTPTATEVVADPALPPEPIPQTITASDGTELEGMLYPAASLEAPLVVLMHWAPGDQTDWAAIAPWLQNRDFPPQIPDNPPPWLMPDWFPEVPAGFSSHVFTFTYRGCEGGCQAFDRQGWLLDTEAAMDHLQTLEEVTFSQVITIGASTGADGAPYGCYYHNENGGSCQGALSLSPGGYLTRPYPEEVKNLGMSEPPTPAWCLYSTDDAQSASACENASGDHYRPVSYPGNIHGMPLVVPDTDPNPLDLILEFLNLTGLCSDCS